MKKMMDLKIKGETKTWIFNVFGDTKYIREWEYDGLDIKVSPHPIPFWFDFSGKKRMAVSGRGKCHEWSFSFDGLPTDLEQWQSDGIDVSIVYNSIPMWIVNCGWTDAYCKIQDFLNKIGL